MVGTVIICASPAANDVVVDIVGHQLRASGHPALVPDFRPLTAVEQAAAADGATDWNALRVQARGACSRAQMDAIARDDATALLIVNRLEWPPRRDDDPYLFGFVLGAAAVAFANDVPIFVLHEPPPIIAAELAAWGAVVCDGTIAALCDHLDRTRGIPDPASAPELPAPTHDTGAELDHTQAVA